MTYKALIFLRLLLFTLIFINCNQSKENQIVPQKKEIKESAKIKEECSEDFDSFFKSFSSNKQFREAHIKFPLEGFNSDENEYNSKNKPYQWEKENWLFYSEEDFGNSKNKDEIKTETIKKDSTTIYRIYKENSGYDIQYTFKKINSKWNLIYYSYKNF